MKKSDDTFPSITQLYSADFDGPASHAGPETKLLVCSTPRTSSNYLAQLAHQAGCGLPLEYFNESFAKQLADRFHTKPVTRKTVPEDYYDTILKHRTINGIFACKLQYPQLTRLVQSNLANDLFDGATVIYLTRRNLTAQTISYTLAILTGSWHGENRANRSASELSDDALAWKLHQSVQHITKDEAGFRRFFATHNITPLHIFQEDMVADPVTALSQIAHAIGRKCDKRAVEAIAGSRSAYKNNNELRKRLREDALPKLEKLNQMNAWQRALHQLIHR